MRILALADDMTGALEVGAKFRAAGIRAVVSGSPSPLEQATAMVFDTETRHVSPELALHRVGRFVRESCASRPDFVFKKTDSTLRGNIRAELQALRDHFPDWSIGYAPAYPALGRTVRNGELFVDGVPVAQTAFSQDALNPVRSGSLKDLVGHQEGCRIFDGETDAHLDEAAGAIFADKAMRIAAGPAGFAEWIARHIEIARHPAPLLPPIRTCLVMNGSRHPTSRVQMEMAERFGCVSPEGGSSWRVISTRRQQSDDAAAVASENAREAIEQLSASESDALFVIGGDTAFAVVTALGAPALWPIGEVLPGIPVSRIESSQIRSVLPGREADLYLISKAGGFGAPDALCRAREKLNGGNGK